MVCIQGICIEESKLVCSKNDDTDKNDDPEIKGVIRIGDDGKIIYEDHCSGNTGLWQVECKDSKISYNKYECYNEDAMCDGGICKKCPIGMSNDGYKCGVIDLDADGIPDTEEQKCLNTPLGEAVDTESGEKYGCSC
jgi:hypothetical protein